MIALCSCLNEWQDKQYGKGQRVHNLCKSPSTKLPNEGKRCTVCGKTTSI